MKIRYSQHVWVWLAAVMVGGCSAPVPRKYEIDAGTQEMLDDMLRDPASYVGAVRDDDPDITVESMGEFDEVAQRWRATEFKYEYLLSHYAYQHHLAEQAFAKASADPNATDGSITKHINTINAYRVKMQNVDVQKKRDHKRERAIVIPLFPNNNPKHTNTINAYRVKMQNVNVQKKRDHKRERAIVVSLRFEYSIPDRVCEYHQSRLAIQAVPVIYGRAPTPPKGYDKARLLGFRHAGDPFYTGAKLEVWAPRKIRVPVCATCTVVRETYLKRGS